LLSEGATELQTTVMKVVAPSEFAAMRDRLIRDAPGDDEVILTAACLAFAKGSK